MICLVYIFHTISIPNYGIIKVIMAKKTQKKTQKNRKISKKAQAEQAERRKLVALFVALFLLIFAATRLGMVGISLYN